MNCGNCGAALAMAPNQTYLFCPYCDTFVFPDAAGDDGICTLNSTSGLDCPLCSQPLLDGTLEGRPVRHCLKCRGILATHESFTDVVRIRRSRRRDEQRVHAPLDARLLERSMTCPACRQCMETHPYYGPGPVVIDTCARCGLLWLDHGELSTIETAAGRT